jgi:hypothetical protein
MSLPVTPGRTYYVNVGAGGAGDVGSGKGEDGGATTVTDAFGTQLTFAGGGAGGDKNATIGAAGGAPDPAAGLQRAGNRGKISTGVGNYQGGAVVAGSVAPPYFMDGGSGNNGRGSGGPGGKGGNGYAILTW